MVRLFISLKLLKNDDVAWLTSIMCIPSYVELGAGIITSCLPTLPKFFKTMAQIPCFAKMGTRLSSLFMSPKPSKSISERSSSSSWVQYRRKPSMSRVERRGLDNYDVLDGWEGQHNAFSTTSLGNVTIAAGMRNEGNNMEMKPVDEERGILRSVQISVVCQGSSSNGGSNV